MYYITYLLQLKLAYHDGSPVQDTKNDVLIAYGYTYNQSAYSNITRKLDEHGMVQLDFYPPKANDNTSFPLNVEVKLLIKPPRLTYKYAIPNCLCIYTGTIFKSP